MEEVCLGEHVGRGLVATRSYHVGEVLLREGPLAAALLPGCVTTRCDWSFVAPRHKLLRCGRCKTMRFASKESQKLAWKEYYQQESAALEALHQSGLGRVTPPALVRLTARVLWLLEARGAVLGGLGSGLESLEGHWDARDATAQAQLLQLAALVRELVRGAAADDDAPSEVVDRPLLVIAQVMSQLACNVHTICSEEQEPLGLGIYCNRAHLFNHDHRPSCVQSFEFSAASRPLLIIRAVRAIRAGDALTISYIDACEPRALQRSRLLRGWFFEEECDKKTADDALAMVTGGGGGDLCVELQQAPADELHVRTKGPAGFSCADEVDCALNAVVEVGCAGDTAPAELFCLAQTCGGDASNNESGDAADAGTAGVRVDLYGDAVGGDNVALLTRRFSPLARRMADAVRLLERAASDLAPSTITPFDLGVRGSTAPRSATSAACHASDALALLVDDAGGDFALGPCHWLRVRAWQAVLDAALQAPTSGGEVHDFDGMAPCEAARWGGALLAARALLPAYDLVYAGPSPALGLHLFKLAKLELLLCNDAGSCRAALLAAERALDLKFGPAGGPVQMQLHSLKAQAEAGAAMEFLSRSKS